MRRLGILLVLVALLPATLTTYGMVQAFNAATSVDEQLVHRAVTLTLFSIPLLLLGVGLQVAAAIRKRQRTRTPKEAS
jgi:hypothetical protein